MTKNLFFLLLISLMAACSGTPDKKDLLTVSSNEELKIALDSAKAGDEIIMANGVWKDVRVEFRGQGTEKAPITLRAETAGKVFIEGQSDLKFGGEYLIVNGLYFRNGYTPSSNLIQFQITKEEGPANHCRLTNCVIEDFNQPRRDRKDHWVFFRGRYNQMDHCYLSGKANEGPTVRVDIAGNQSIKNFHKIINNHFGPRPRKGGPKGETIQLGDSFSSVSPSNTLIANNLFEKCNGEVEVISSKTNFNEFRNNVFFQCEGSLVTRHGNYCVIDGNYFIGDGESENYGGIRLINTGHWVTNNYFYNLKGTNFRSPLAIMNGIPKSPQNRYNQVTDVVVAYNSWINCNSPLQFGVGTNISQRDVLPKSEIRSARPIRTIVANNLIYNEAEDEAPLVEHDKADRVAFKNNVHNPKVDFGDRPGFTSEGVELKSLSEYIMVPASPVETELYAGFEFETIANDIFGTSRSDKNMVGAVSSGGVDPKILDKTKYGADWYSNEKEAATPNTHEVSSEDELIAKLSEAQPNDIVSLAPGTYSLSSSLLINKKITVASKVAEDKAVIIYSGDAETPAFEMNPKGDLTLKGIVLKGEKNQYAFASLKENMSSHYNLMVEDCEISNFNYILKAYKQTFAEEITFANTVLKDSQNGLELSAETNDKGDYNVEFFTIEKCHFENIKANVIDYYRGGYDESTIGGNLSVTHSTFTKCGGKETNGILLNTRGIVNVDISDNTFKSNSVKLVALLWGAKNNTHSDNDITSSGKITVEENLKLKLVY